MVRIQLLTETDLQEVAALEAAAYPPGFCLGYEDFLGDFQSCAVNYSLGARIRDRLVAYLVAFEYDGDRLYVSDLVCQNVRALLPLLQAFEEKAAGRLVTAELRETSNRLLTKLSARYPDKLQIIEKDHMPRYYGKEDAYSVELALGQVVASLAS